MARSPRSLGRDDSEEKVQTLSSGPIEDVELPPVDQQSNAVVADARDKNPPAKGAGPTPKVYRVTRGGMILHNGYRTKMQVGKEIDDLNYDVRKLRQQGILLEEIKPEERTAAPPSQFDE